ncbi:iron-siderophore ABC transporter substrate-binding protein [Nocardioides guangzhouensis]|uniref:Iron-siderophore ABC transporter substrate-binding protein n=1 Tax=Nocardioides guangzhouensis TaxID=2497878 RepID=A0A4Q4ZBR9_9ACTN|nr:iron-siderophore ABC transporter substrate-binding protein [Nocardioides guangzhouensis]RYP85372.1 iron-siderophore ABC transporter substrate-binding protein [Nocardioides guangzhouensis]
MRSRSFPVLAAAGAVLVGLALTGCATGSTEAAETPDSVTPADASAFPVTIDHAFGSTTIEKEPQRVATLGWSDQDNALALGVVPVGATKLTWGGNDAGSSDWFDATLEESGADAPVRYDDSDGAPVEEIAKLDPDLILATNSGITEQEYTKLSKIAPVVAYPEAPWVTPWQTSLEMVGTALGRSSQAAQVKADTEREIADARAEHPQLDGASMIFGYLTTTDLSQVGIYAPRDPRVAFMHDLGLVDAPSVAGAIKPGEFYGSVSAERSADLDSDVFLTWAENPGDVTTFTDDKLIGMIPAIASGHAYAEDDKHVSLAVTNPTPLSIPVIIEEFVPEVAQAVDGTVEGS